MNLLRRFLFALFMALSALAAGGVTRVAGIVVDSITKQPIPFVAILLEGTERGVLTDDHGQFSIDTDLPFTAVAASSMGYEPKSVAKRNDRLKYIIELSPTGVRLNELVVRPKKEKYSKKNNPAVNFMKAIRQGGEASDPERLPHFNYNKYERITLALDNINPGTPGDSTTMSPLLKKFPMLREHIDTSAFTGRPILNVALREKSSHINYRRDPKSTKETVAGLRREGIDEFLDPAATQTLYEDVLRDIDVYGNDITLMQNRFVSPLAKIGPDFYKYYLTDTVQVGRDSCVVLTFVPHNTASFGFAGRMFVLKNDSTFFVKRIEMQAPRDINLNYIVNLRIVQEFDRAPDGTRLKKLDDMIVEAAVLSSKGQLYARRVSAYAGHDFNAPPDSTVFDLKSPSTILEGADRRPDEFWQNRRLVSIGAGENSVGKMLTRLRKVKIFYWGEKILRLLVSGYQPLGRNSKYDVGPVNTLASYNALEGWRFRVGGMSTANLSKRWFTREYIAWGTHDHRWKYSAELEYSFHDKRYHSREFPIHSLRATHLYDVDRLGQHFLFTNPDNFFLSLSRKPDLLMTYHRVTKLDYTLELENNFSVALGLKHERQEESPYIKFFDGTGRFFSHYSMASATLTLRYAPGEKFYQTKSSRLPVNLDAPVFQLSHTFAPKDAFGNRFALNVTEASFQKRFWFSAFGYVDMILRGGHVWSRSPFPNLLIPNANLSYTIQPEAFCLMNPMEFINDSYASWDATYWANGALFNLIPGLKKLKLREAVVFRGVWGHLSSRNNPAENPDLFRFPPNAFTHPMTSTPYMELGVGIDNIFTILRLDYTWRLTYRDTPGAPNSGLRLALHFTF